MSANVNVNVKLSDRIPNVSQLTDLVGQIKTEIGKIEIPGMPTADIDRLVRGFDITLPDTSAWSSVIPADAAGLLKNFPDPASLARPLGGPLEQIKKVFSIDYVKEIARIQESLNSIGPPSLESPEALLNGLLDPLSKIGGTIKDSEFTKLIIEIGKFLGAEDIARLSDDLPALVTRLQAILREKIGGSILAIASVSAAATITDKTERLVKTISDSFSLESTNARFQALLGEYGSGATGLVGQIRSLDLSDPAKVEALQVRLRATNDAYQTFYASLVRDMAFSEASLALMNVTAIQERLEKIGETLSGVDANQLESLAAALKGAIEKAKGAINFDGVLNIAQFKDVIKSGLAQVEREIARLDPAKIKGVLESFFNIINEPLKKFEEFKIEIEAIVRSAFQTVREAIEKIDLTPLRNSFDQAMGGLESKLIELDRIFTAVRRTIDDSLKQVKIALEGVRSFILDPENGLKKKIEDLFNSIFQVFDALNLKQVVDNISQTAQTISQGLVKIEFTPVIDTTVDAIEVVSDVLSKVAPLLVTDDLKQKLAEATAFLKKIDFDAISDTLVKTFDEILDSIDEEALGKFKQEYQKVIDAVGRFDPSPMLQEVQKEVFDPLIAEMEKIKPAELLRPVQEGYDTISDALNGFNPAETFSFITEFFDGLIAKFRDISPAKLLEPIEAALNEIQTAINSVLRIDELFEALDKANNFILPLLDNFDPGQALDFLESAHARVKSELNEFDPGLLLKTPAAILRDIFSGAGMEINIEGFKGMVEAVKSKTGGLGEKISSIQRTLEQSRDRINQLDVRSFLTALRARHDELNAAVAVHGSAFDLGLSLEVRALDPMPLLSPLITKVDRVKAGFASKTGEFAASARKLSSALQPVDEAARALSAFLSPLDTLKQLSLEPFNRLFSGQTFSDPKELLIHYLDEMDPAQWRGELEPLLAGIQMKLKALFGDAVMGPVRDLLDSVKEKIALLDIAFLREAIEGVFDEVEEAIQQLNPAPIIEAVDNTYKRILGLLEKLNPADFIADIERLYTEDVVGVVKAISPEELLLPILRELFEKIKGLLIDLDIEIIFKPILDHLRSLKEQLQEGLERAGEAFEGLVNSIPTGSASASVSVTVG